MNFEPASAPLTAAIDGKHARTLNDCKLVVNPTTMAVFYGLLASNRAVTLPDYFLLNSVGIMTTNIMPVVASTISKGIVSKTGPGVMYNGIAKMWGGVIQVIRDELQQSLLRTSSFCHERDLYADYDVVRPAGYLQVEFKES